jgi:hypothetical protein
MAEVALNVTASTSAMRAATPEFRAGPVAAEVWTSWSPANARSYSPTTIASKLRFGLVIAARRAAAWGRWVQGRRRNSRHRSTPPRSPQDRRADRRRSRTATPATRLSPGSRRWRCGRRTRTATHPPQRPGVRPSGTGAAAAAAATPPAGRPVPSSESPAIASTSIRSSCLLRPSQNHRMTRPAWGSPQRGQLSLASGAGIRRQRTRPTASEAISVAWKRWPRTRRTTAT